MITFQIKMMRFIRTFILGIALSIFLASHPIIAKDNIIYNDILSESINNGFNKDKEPPQTIFSIAASQYGDPKMLMDPVEFDKGLRALKSMWKIGMPAANTVAENQTIFRGGLDNTQEEGIENLCTGMNQVINDQDTNKAALFKEQFQQLFSFNQSIQDKLYPEDEKAENSKLSLLNKVMQAANKTTKYFDNSNISVDQCNSNLITTKTLTKIGKQVILTETATHLHANLNASEDRLRDVQNNKKPVVADENSKQDDINQENSTNITINTLIDTFKEVAIKQLVLEGYDILDQVDSELNSRTKKDISPKVVKSFKQQQEVKATKLTPQDYFDLAEKADERAMTAWEKATHLTEASFDFWNQWEKAIETAKEAYHGWEDWLTLPQDQESQESLALSTSNVAGAEQQKRAEHRKNFWLEQLKTAKIEPPLEIKEEDKKEPAILSSTVASISLPAVDVGDAERLALLKQIEELKSMFQAQKEDSTLPDTRPRCSSSLADDFPLEQANNEKIRNLTEEYEALVRSADERRVQQLRSSGEEEKLFPPNNKELHKTWEKRDRVLLQAQQEGQIREEKEARDARRAATWEMDNHRWNILARVNELWETFKERDHYYRIFNKAQNFDDEDWRQQQKEKEDRIKQLKEQHAVAEQEWKQMALEHPDMCKAREQGDDLTAAEKRLKKSDRIILDLRRDFNDQVYQGVANIRIRTRAALPEEIKRCKMAILQWKKGILDELDKANLTLEEYAQNYANDLKRAALKDAKDNIPGDREAYEAIALQSAQEAEVASRQVADFQRNETKRTKAHLDAIAAADRAAYETWCAERQYLDDIQNKWKDQLEELAERRRVAAQAYFQDDPLPWIMLTPQERYYYNAPILYAKEAAAPRSIQEAIEKLEQAYEHVRALENSFTIPKAQKILREQEKEEAYQKLIKLLHDEIEKREQSTRAAEQEVERLHASNSWFSGSSRKEKQQSIDTLVEKTAVLLDLHAEVRKQERKYAYEKADLSLQEQNEKELSIQARKEAAKETYLKWIRQTPQEKNNQIYKLEQLAKTYQKAAESLERCSVALTRKKAYGAEKQEDGRVVCEIALWNKLVDSGKQLYCAVRQLEKATEAKNNGNSEIATFYLQLAEQEQVLGEHYKKAVQRFYNVFSTYEVAESARARDRLSNAADLLDKATEAKSQGNPEIVTLYLQLAEQEQALAEHHRKAAIDCLEKNVANAALDKAAKSAEASGDRLCRVACKLDEATEAKSQGNLEIATLLQFTEQEQASSLEYLKAAQAYAEGNNEEGDQLFQAAEEVAKGKSY